MKFGVNLPNYGAVVSALSLAELAAEAEAAGWDGFFLWDHILASKNQGLQIVDPWVALAAMAMTTESIQLGTALTPVARRRPWKLARETVTLDHLSLGRLILGVGLGAPVKQEFEHFGEDGDRRARAEKLDEGLAILEGLWRGKPFAFKGKHYSIDKIKFQPPALQEPRIPIWVGGFWPNPAPFRRAARWDGALPLKHNRDLTPDEMGAVRDFILEHRTSKEPFDLVHIGTLSGKPTGVRKTLLAAHEAAGVTWWQEEFQKYKDDFKALKALIRQGPPR
ncbi:MAG: LLM class flavin-dependent oxidoreductase [Anaerolineae bacterium]|nr:MAG: LLM class flavin-dependent oxidoreductase [Anaerolineae bacterium]